jgi:hypothetical protein
VSNLASRRPNQNDHAAVQVTHGDSARFAIIMPNVRNLERPAGEDFRSLGEVEPTVLERRFPLVGIERDLRYLCTHNK